MTVEMISHLLEALMILCFGLSWPLSIYKSWTSRTAKGKSLYFEVFIWIGYIFGIANKFISYMNNPDKDWIFFLAASAPVIVAMVGTQLLHRLPQMPAPSPFPACSIQPTAGRQSPGPTHPPDSSR